MKHSSVRQQLFSLFSAAFRRDPRQKRNGWTLPSGPSRLKPIWSGFPGPQGLSTNVFKELQQLRRIARDRGRFAQGQENVLPEPRHLRADCLLPPRSLRSSERLDRRRSAHMAGAF